MSNGAKQLETRRSSILVGTDLPCTFALTIGIRAHTLTTQRAPRGTDRARKPSKVLVETLRIPYALYPIVYGGIHPRRSL